MIRFMSVALPWPLPWDSVKHTQNHQNCQKVLSSAKNGQKGDFSVIFSKVRPRKIQGCEEEEPKPPIYGDISHMCINWRRAGEGLSPLDFSGPDLLLHRGGQPITGVSMDIWLNVFWG